ncbi:MAG: PGPGW domain-containing protein [Verrucomicrobiota bacterium]
MKKFFIALMGGTVLVVGAAMLILPGPGLLVIAAGLGILATEFLWAKRALCKAKGAVAKAQRKGGWLSWLRRKKSVPVKSQT